MPFLPVAAREVREASRQPRTYAWRCGTAGAALCLMAFVGWVTRFQSNQGQSIFMAGSIAAFIYCMLAGIVRTADTLSEEKRDNTLGLLFLTDLRGWDIVSGKLLSSSINCIFGLVALMPMLAVPLMMGGVGGLEFVRVLCGLLNALFVSISVGILISSIFRQSGFTISLGLVAGIFLGGILPFICLFLREEYRLNALSNFLFLFSPLQGLVMAFEANRRSPMDYFWWSLLVNHAIAWINLALAVYCLPRFWQEAPKNKKAELWRDRVRAWRFGAGHRKKTFRTRLLNQNPLFWLSGREQIGSGALMSLSAVILIISLICGGIAGRTTFRGPERLMISWFCGMAVVHLMLAFRISMAASSRLAEDRRSGALELLLGTEMSIQEILRGQWMGLGRQFFGPILIVLLSSVFALALVLLSMAGEVGTTGILDTIHRLYQRMIEDSADTQLFWIFFIACTIMALLCINWIGLVWTGMWLGLREKRSGFATWTTLAVVMLPPWIIFIIGMMMADDAGFFQRVSFERGIPMVMAIVWTLGLGHIVLLSVLARRNLLRRFREAAADRFMSSRRLSWRWFGRVVLRFAAVMAILFVLFTIARIAINRRGEAAWKQAQAAHPGFILNPTFPVTAPKHPDEDNLAAAPMLLPLSMGGKVSWTITWNMAPVVGMSGMEELPWDWTQSRLCNLEQILSIYRARKVILKSQTNAAEAIRAALSKYDSALATLHEEAAKRPRTEFGPATQQVAPSPWYYFGATRAPIKNLVDVLALRAAVKIAHHDPALDDILLALRLADGVKDAPSMMDKHLMLIDLVQPVYDGLCGRVWNAAELQRLQEKFAALDLWTQYDRWREQHLRDAFNGLESAVARRDKKRSSNSSLVDRYLPIGFLRQQEADLLKWGYDDLPKAFDSKNHHIDPAAVRSLRASRPDLGIQRGMDEWTTTLNTLGLAQTTADQIVIACALERFRIDHGKLPATAQELVPKYLAAIPNDVFTGHPLAIKIKPDLEHFTIVGFGPDGAEEHGQSMMMNGLNPWMLWQEMRGYDWIWDSHAKEPPQPRRRVKK